MNAIQYYISITETLQLYYIYTNSIENRMLIV